jgi:hypothetical protein
MERGRIHTGPLPATFWRPSDTLTGRRMDEVTRALAEDPELLAVMREMTTAGGTLAERTLVVGVDI